MRERRERGCASFVSECFFMLLGFVEALILYGWGWSEEPWASSSCSRFRCLLPLGWSSLFPLMLSPSPSSESVYSKETSVTSPSGVLAFSPASSPSGRTSKFAGGIYVGSICVSLASGSPECLQAVCASLFFGCLCLSDFLFFFKGSCPLSGMCCQEFRFRCLFLS